MNENLMHHYQVKLQAELDQIRHEFLADLKQASNHATEALIDTLQSSPPHEWVDIASDRICPGQFPNFERLVKVEAAICQMDIGQFGYCCDCEKKIEDTLLAVDPAAQRCLECVAKQK
ncbi:MULTISPECIES: TraR/DksA C4-type zinc finger protein [Pseudoalteromonas]|uniref:Conjugal transfer protein TraR n=1 Tax=Pseudoalteromonas viridis TaxID=339617 RepID=A0ABX7V2M9_9GAMM|nr:MULTISPECIES: TraR/DksA C4-type zinc finger protein [Pseudoalteromonas]QTL35143.1 conjugal transfer protein TraR [Pseudoalteromonas viridis]